MLNCLANIEDCDDFYEALISAHNGLSEVESAKLNAKLILFLANHIGDIEVLKSAISKATQLSNSSQ